MGGGRIWANNLLIMA